MSDLIDSALARAVRWEDVPASWAGHRAEPLAAQRLWACEADGLALCAQLLAAINKDEQRSRVSS